MQRSESVAALSKALCAAQRQIKPAIKDSENPHFRSKYADLASCWDACREALGANGLAVVQIPLATERDEVQLETILVHESGEYIGGVLSIPVSKQDAQGYGSALTYARRYALCSLVGIAPGEDDGNAAASAAPPPRPPAPRPQAAPAATPGRINADQRRQLIEAWRGAGHDDDAVMAWLAKAYTVNATKDIRVVDFTTIVARVEQPEPFPDEPGRPPA